MATFGMDIILACNFQETDTCIHTARSKKPAVAATTHTDLLNVFLTHATLQENIQQHLFHTYQRTYGYITNMKPVKKGSPKWKDFNKTSLL